MFAKATKKFVGNLAGSVLPTFAIAAIPLFVAMGGVVDYTNAFDKQTMVQDAMDSAALAAGKKIGLLSMTELQQDVDNFYVANIKDKLKAPPPLATSVNLSTITLTTELVVPTYFLRMIGIDQLVFPLKSQATLALGTLEVVMVLDNSGSMNTDDNIATLRQAATNLTNTLYNLGTTSTKPNPVKVGLVPFAAAVNVGAQYANDVTATWLDKTGIGTYNMDAMEAHGASSGTNPLTLFAGLKDSAGNPVTWGGCMEARPMPYDATDDGASAGVPSTMYVPMFAADDPDNWNCSTGTCSNVGSTYSNRRYSGAPTGAQNYNNYLPDSGDPKTCGNIFTVTRANPAVFTLNNHGLSAGDKVVPDTTGSLYSGLTAGTQYYVLSTGLTSNTFRVSTSSGGSAVATSGSQSGVHYLMTSRSWTCADGDANCGGANDGVSEGTAFGRTCKYGTAANKAAAQPITVGGIPGGPNFMCTTTAVTPMTTDKPTITNSIAGMIALGATNIQEGLMWGWRLLSPGAPFVEGRAYSVNDNQKILILMTDGFNTYYPKTNSNLLKSWYGAWGYVARSHLGSTSTNQNTLIDKMNERTALACQNVKAAGIIVYTVSFQVEDADTLGMMRACATEPSMAYVSTSQGALLSAFSAIGDEITLLRISQ